MSELIDSDDVYHVLRALLNELPADAAKLERDPKWGRSVLTPTRRGAATLYALGNTDDCEIGIVEITHSHFHDRDEAVEYCRAMIRGEIQYTVWRDGNKVVRAQRHHEPIPDGGTQIDVFETVPRKTVSELRKEHLRFQPYVQAERQ